MKKIYFRACLVLGLSISVLITGCASGGFNDQSDHKVNVLTATQDTKPLSLRVRTGLRNNGQTATAGIRVSQDSEDTVKLTGAVFNDAIRAEAERVAYGVDGVRFVVNNLTINR